MADRHEARPINRETLDFLVEHLRDVPAEQASVSIAWDAKAVQVFAAASVVVGLAAAGPLADRAPVGVVIAALACYLVAALLTLLTLWPTQLRTTRQADQLWNDFYDEPLEELKHSIMADLAGGYPENERRLKCKRWLFSVLLLAAAGETILVGVALTTSLA